MNKDMPSLGELMYPMHHSDSRRDKINQRKAEFAEKKGTFIRSPPSVAFNSAIG